jgi:cytochrome c oxidase subunit 2
MAISPPVERIWWRQPIQREELIWIIVAFAWGLVMFFMMIYWHAFGQQNLSNETYRITPDAFAARTQAMIDKYQVRDDEGIPVVRPPAGSDVYLLGRVWMWYPHLELERGQSYRLHRSSMDYQHGFSLQPVPINLQVHPGYEMVLTLTPSETGEFGVVCNEYCGLGHHLMVGKIYVVDRK